MDEDLKEVVFYEVIPEFNSDGRLCNHGSGSEEPVKVPVEEWERFNQLAGRQHEIVDGVVVFNEDLEPCMPDPEPIPPTVEELAEQNTLLELAVVEQYEENMTLRETVTNLELAITELYEEVLKDA